MNNRTHLFQSFLSFLSRLGQRRTAFSLIVLGFATALALSSPAVHAQTYTKQTLSNFGISHADGGAPRGDLVNVNGTFYGITSGLGYTDTNTLYGTIFSFNPTTHTRTVLYTFTNTGGDGAYPLDGLTYDSATGLLYGTAEYGGTGGTFGNGDDGDGTIFSFNPTTHVEKTVFNFTGLNDIGANPYVRLLDVNGTLYGTTEYGGSQNYGTVFSFNTATHAVKTLHSFVNTGGDGDYPHSDLIYDSTTKLLYGTTQYGGTGFGTLGNGTVYSVDPTTGDETILYRFGSTSGDGEQPMNGLCEVNGVLYGTTYQGGSANFGTLFSVDLATNTYHQRLSFGGAAAHEPQYPLGDLVYDSVSKKLFGTSIQGGDDNYGMVYSYDPSAGTGDALYSFQGAPTDGQSAIGGLLAVNGILYGTTLYGGIDYSGDLFSLSVVTPPVAVDNSNIVKHDTPLTVPAPGVLGNDSNGGEGPMTATLVTNVTHGTLTLSSNGAFTYTPNAGYVGTDHFTYRVANPLYSGNIATATLTVQGTVPTAVNNSNNVKANTPFMVPAPGVLGNDTNGGGGTMTALLVTSTTHGTLTLSSNGAFTYKPNTGFVGTDSFTYQAVNSVGKSNIATATLIVQLSAPTAVNNSNNVPKNTTFTVASPGVLGNDFNGGSTPMTALLVTGTTHGTLTLSSNGAFTYKPNTGFTGTDSFTYQAVNSVGKSNIATATLIVQ